MKHTQSKVEDVCGDIKKNFISQVQKTKSNKFSAK